MRGKYEQLWVFIIAFVELQDPLQVPSAVTVGTPHVPHFFQLLVKQYPQKVYFDKKYVACNIEIKN